jgi:predicted PurR-regulated permease PerM
MMESVAFIAIAIILYFLSDWILDRIERAIGRRFEYRTLIFFGLLLGLTLLTFAAIRQFTDLV